MNEVEPDNTDPSDNDRLADESDAPLILVADDDHTMRVLARSVISELGLRFAEADSGPAALAMIQEHHPTIVLLDVVMPGMNGFEVCARTREQSSNASMAIVMLTGLTDLASVQRAFDAGATDFITKPVNPKVLEHRIQYILRAIDAHRELLRRQSRLDLAQRLSKVGYWEANQLDQGVVLSKELRSLLELSPDIVPADDDYLRLLPVDQRSKLVDLRQRAWRTGEAYEIEYRLAAPDGDDRFLREQGEVLLDESERPFRLVGTLQDVTDRRRSDACIEFLAYRDSLTSLPNRRLFRDRLERTLTRAARQDTLVACLFLDLDRFKRVNDTLGHSSGDDLLRRVGERVAGSIRSADPASPDHVEAPDPTLARFGGDEFVVMLEGLRKAEDAAAVGQRIVDALSQPFKLAGREVYITASIGITVSPQDGDDVETLLSNADAAMYCAKEEGGQGFHFFTPEVSEAAGQRLVLETEINRALENDELFLEYQPLFAAANGALAGVEALVRWQHPDRGPLPPAEFIALANETGLIVPIGEYVLEQACSDWKTQLDNGAEPVRVAVNLSARQFSQSDVVMMVRRILRRTDFPAELLDLEITEGGLILDTEASHRRLQELKVMGVGLAVDDFGAGSSSLSCLKSLPIDSLKIDPSFVRGIAVSAEDESIIAAIIAMAHGLDLKVVAEGVELRTHQEFLTARGCDALQGFLFGRPAPIEQLRGDGKLRKAS